MASAAAPVVNPKPNINCRNEVLTLLVVWSIKAESLASEPTKLV